MVSGAGNEPARPVHSTGSGTHATVRASLSWISFGSKGALHALGMVGLRCHPSILIRAALESANVTR